MIELITLNPFFTGAASACSIIALAVIVFQFVSNRSKRLFFQRTSEVLIMPSPSSAIRQKLMIAGRETERLNVDTFVLLNKSKKGLTSESFTDLPYWDLATSTNIHAQFVLDGFNGASANWKVENGRLEVVELRMPRNSAVALAVFHDGSISDSINVAPIDIPDPKKKKLIANEPIWSLRARWMPFVVAFAASGVIFMSENFVKYLLGNGEIEILIGQIKLFILVAPIFSLIFALLFRLWIYLLPTSVKRDGSHLEFSTISDTALHTLERSEENKSDKIVPST